VRPGQSRDFPRGSRLRREAVLADFETRMREAADLNFEEAARLRDEVKRLRANWRKISPTDVLSIGLL